MTRLSATARQALEAMRNCPDKTDAGQIAAAVEVLVAYGSARADAQIIAQAVFDKHMRVMGP